MSRPWRLRARSTILLGAGIVLVAMNLRPAAAGVGPLIHRIRAGTGLSGTGAGLLVTLPVLCFGALAPLAPALARRLGTQATLAVALGVLTAGLLVRVVPGLGFLFVGTAMAGAAIAVANVLLPVLVRRSFHERTGLITGLYTTALIGAAALAAGVSIPVADALGGGWRGGLAVWAAPAAIALLMWLPLVGGRPTDSRTSREHHVSISSLLHDRVAWALTLFFAIQSAGFYTTLAWLPSIFRNHGAGEAQGGVLLSVTLVVGLAGALTVPSLAVRARDQRVLVLVFVACAAIGWIGILAAPMSAPYLWSVLLGLGQNALFPLALTLIVLRGGTVALTAGLSTLVQSVGYLLAAAAPLGIGALHDASGSWTLPLIVLLVLMVPQALTGLAAGRPGHVTAREVQPASSPQPL